MLKTSSGYTYSFGTDCFKKKLSLGAIWYGIIILGPFFKIPKFDSPSTT